MIDRLLYVVTAVALLIVLMFDQTFAENLSHAFGQLAIPGARSVGVGSGRYPRRIDRCRPVPGAARMIILFGIAAAIIGGLFWADRRRYYRHTYGPVIASNDQDIGGGDVDAYCDDACDDTETFCPQDDYQDDGNDDYQDDNRGSSNDYGSSSTGGGRDD